MSDEKRHSERVIPMVSDEEMVVVDAGARRFLAKLMDLSDSGTLLYLLSDPVGDLPSGTTCRLSLYHQGNVFGVPSSVARVNGHLIAFHFVLPESGIPAELQAKLIRMEVEWTRLQGLV